MEWEETRNTHILENSFKGTKKTHMDTSIKIYRKFN